MKVFKQFGIATFAFLLMNSTVLIQKANAQVDIYDDYQDDEQFEVDHEEGVSGDFSVWCHDTMMALRRGQSNARQAYAFGNPGQSLRIFGQTLANYATRPGAGVANSMTYRLILRSSRILQILQTQMKNERDLKTAALFMDSMFDFISETANRLDLNYFQGPTRGCGRRCLRNYMQEAEELLIDTAFDQVDLALKNFYQEYSGRVTPVGSPRVVLRITQLLVEGAIDDLQSTLAANYYACAIVNLRAIRSELAAYNSNPRSIPHIGNIAQATAHFYYQIEDALGTRPECRY